MDPKKYLTIMGMSTPNNLKDLRIIQGKVQVIIRFIAQLADMTSLFSHLLKKDKTFIWDEKCQNTLDNIKRYLTNVKVLGPYDLEKYLLFYV